MRADLVTPRRPTIFTFTAATGDSDFGDCRCPNCRPALYRVVRVPAKTGVHTSQD